jgi:hypothetical protein
LLKSDCKKPTICYLSNFVKPKNMINRSLITIEVL